MSLGTSDRAVLRMGNHGPHPQLSLFSHPLSSSLSPRPIPMVSYPSLFLLPYGLFPAFQALP